MGWKNVQEHYRIEHSVVVRAGKILIGSAYVPELLIVGLDGAVSWGQLGEGDNDDLNRYYAEMTADPKKLSELIEAPDTFEADITVYTYDGAEIIEKQCEAPEWPNCTHDGELMYENMFSADKAKVVAWAKRNAELGVKFARDSIETVEQEHAELIVHLANERADVAKLEADYPSEG